MVGVRGRSVGVEIKTALWDLEGQDLLLLPIVVNRLAPTLRLRAMMRVGFGTERAVLHFAAMDESLR